MATVQQLNDAAAAVSTSAGQLTAAVPAIVAALQSGASIPDAAVQQITDASTAVNTALQQIQAAVPPAPTP